VKYDLKAGVLLVAWLIGIVYSTIPFFWFMVHPFADFWRRQRSPFRILLPLWILLWIVVATITWPWHTARLEPDFWPWIVAAFFFVVASSVYRRIQSNLGVHIVLGLAELRPQQHEQKLVTTGMYARTRHPIYLAHFCMLLAWTIGSGLLVNYALLVSTIITGTFMIFLEERELEKRFGEQFIKYRERVPVLWPKERQIEERIFLQKETIFWEFIIDGEKKNSWQFAWDQLVCLGEYTISSWGDDYFFVFVTRDGYCYESSFYARGRDELLEALGKKLNSTLACGLCNSTEWKSRIIWPATLEDQEFYTGASEKIRINARVLELTQPIDKVKQ